MNVLVIVKERSDKFNWILENIKDDYNADNIEIIISNQRYLFIGKKLKCYHLMVLVDPGFTDIVIAYLFVPVKNIVIIDINLKWCKPNETKWVFLMAEIIKEVKFFEVFLKSIFCGIISQTKDSIGQFLKKILISYRTKL